MKGKEEEMDDIVCTRPRPCLEMEMLEPLETTEDSVCVNYYYLNNDGKSWEQLDQNTDVDTATDRSGLSADGTAVETKQHLCTWSYHQCAFLINI